MRHTKWLGVLLLLVPVLGAWLSTPEKEVSLQGMWSQHDPVTEGDPVRFYYFHTGGIGLFRYGKMGLTYTKSFHYEAKDGVLELTFLKTGKRHAVAYRIDADEPALVLEADPMLGGEQRYGRAPTGSGHYGSQDSGHPLARMWISKIPAKGGQDGFRMYQLQKPALDGRGVGWYHEGDHAEWSTEALTYRKTGDKLELRFTLRDERSTTPVHLGEAHGTRYLELGEDPRNFWHMRRYMDGGPGFSVLLDGEPMPYHVPGHGAGHGGAHGGASSGSGCPHAR